MSSDAPAVDGAKVDHRPPVIVVDDSDRPSAYQIENALKPHGFSVHFRQFNPEKVGLVTDDAADLLMLDFDAGYVKRLPGSAAVAATVPIIFLTGSADAAVTQAIFDAGGCDYLLKPVRPCEVLARVNAVMDRRRMQYVHCVNQRLRAALHEARTICHELNQPLQFILGSIQLMLMDLKESDPAAPKMRTMAERSEQMGVITGRLNQILRSWNSAADSE